MKKRKKIRKKMLRVSIIVLLCTLSAIAGFYFQRKKYFVNEYVEVDYKTVDTKVVDKLSMVMVGDALIHDAVYYAYQKGNNYDFTGMFKYIKPVVQEYDLAYYNQETILGGKELGLSNYPQFNSPYEVGDGFLDAGFNLVSMATNHTLDKYYWTGGKTTINSRNYWNAQMEKNEDLIAAGSYNSKEEQEEIIIREKNNIKYALLSYTIHTNGLSVPSGKDYVVNIYNKDRVKKDIEKYRDKVDLLMVAMHWGEEYIHYPVTQQKEIAKYLASLNVDIIIGCHSHSVQPIQFIGKTLVIYSLGNFVSSQIDTDQLIGLMADVDITKTTYHGKTTLELSNVGADLLYTNKSSTYGRFVVYPFSKLNNNILYNYKGLYSQYSNYVKAYDKNIKMKGV